MSTAFALAVAAIAGCGLYMMLSRHVVRLILGVALLSAATNLAIFLSGRIGTGEPPVIPAGETVLPASAANPLAQALILTAIVIGLALTVFMAALALATFRQTRTLDARALQSHAAARAGDPGHDDGHRP